MINKRIRNRAVIFFILAFLFFNARAKLYAWEMGFLLANNFSSENNAGGANINPNDFYEQLKFSTWLSFRPAKSVSLYFKGSFNLLNEAVFKDDWKMAGELDAAVLSIAPVPIFYAEFGRIYYRDILGMVADSSFDGAAVRLGGAHHSISAGVYYSGLIYKETAKILMSDKDKEEYYAKSYFAPKHLFLQATYQFSPKKKLQGSLFELSFIKHFDLRKYTVNESAFLLLNGQILLPNKHKIDAGAVVSIEVKGSEDDILSQNDNPWDFGFNGIVRYSIPVTRSFSSILGFELGFYYGNFKEVKPTPTLTQKNNFLVYNPVLARILALKAAYIANFNKYLSFDCNLTVFGRLSTEKWPDFWLYNDFVNQTSEGFILGGELDAMLIWTPLSDFSLSAGVGFFFPSRGLTTVYEISAPVKWDIKLGLLFSF